MEAFSAKENRGVAFCHHRGYAIKPLAIATVESLRDERGSGSAKHSPTVIPAHAKRVGTSDGMVARGLAAEL